MCEGCYSSHSCRVPSIPPCKDGNAFPPGVWESWISERSIGHLCSPGFLKRKGLIRWWKTAFGKSLASTLWVLLNCLCPKVVNLGTSMPNLYLGPNDFEVLMALTNFSYLGESLIKSLTHVQCGSKVRSWLTAYRTQEKGSWSQASQTDPTSISWLPHY